MLSVFAPTFTSEKVNFYVGLAQYVINAPFDFVHDGVVKRVAFKRVVAGEVEMINHFDCLVFEYRDVVSDGFEYRVRISIGNQCATVFEIDFCIYWMKEIYNLRNDLFVLQFLWSTVS